MPALLARTMWRTRSAAAMGAGLRVIALGLYMVGTAGWGITARVMGCINGRRLMGWRGMVRGRRKVVGGVGCEDVSEEEEGVVSRRVRRCWL